MFSFPDHLLSSCSFYPVSAVYHSPGAGRVWLGIDLAKIYTGVLGVQPHPHLQCVQGVQGRDREHQNSERSNIFCILVRLHYFNCFRRFLKMVQ